MKNDPIVQQVHETRERLAVAFDYGPLVPGTYIHLGAWHKYPIGCSETQTKSCWWRYTAHGFRGLLF